MYSALLAVPMRSTFVVRRLFQIRDLHAELKVTVVVTATCISRRNTSRIHETGSAIVNEN